jgi:hypothetical protein
MPDEPHHFGVGRVMDNTTTSDVEQIALNRVLADASKFTPAYNVLAPPVVLAPVVDEFIESLANAAQGRKGTVVYTMCLDKLHRITVEEVDSNL